MLLFPRRRVDEGLLTGNSLHRAGDGVLLHLLQPGGRLGADRSVHDSVLPDYPGQFPGVHPADARNVLPLQVCIQIHFTAEVGRGGAPLPGNIPPDGAASLEIPGNHAVVSHQGIGLQHNLPVIAGVRQRFKIATHAGGKHQLPHRVPACTEANPLKYLPVLQNQIRLFHAFSTVPFPSAIPPWRLLLILKYYLLSRFFRQSIYANLFINI
ncbi:hypothetical protein SDC9_75912 [bioreactor metagenome]|uniref:Uncharacterized protein n=1 Tax=bioreactor metagenome TaxID=1076179 RepID=A0A644YL51_9ZZZZ